MTSSIVISLDPKVKSSKELIIHTLGNRWPLSAKEIHYALIREQGFSTTYQATHKSVKELINQDIIVKENKKYKLNKEWINKTKNYLESLNLAYENKEYVIESEKIINFDNYTDFSLTLGNMFNSRKLMGSKYTDTYVMARHLFWPLKFDFKDFELCMSVGLNAKPHIAAQNSSPFDKLIKKYYEIAKWPKVVIGANITMEEDLIVQGHTIVQIKYSEKTKKHIDEIYSKVHDLGSLFSIYMKNNIGKLEIEMKITQNPQLAELLIKNIKMELGEEK